MSKTIQSIMLNLSNRQLNGDIQEFDIYNDALDRQWTIRFEFFEDGLYMIAGATVWFNNIEDIKDHLNNSFLSNNDFKLM